MSRTKIIISIIVSLCAFLVLRLVLSSPDKPASSRETGLTQENRPSRPELPLRYAVGEIDPRFGITRERFAVLVEDARRVWEEAAGRELLLQSEEAEFKINLIFDWRQEKLIAAREARAVLDENGRSFDKVQDEYNYKLSILETSRSSLEGDARRFEERLQDYNSRVARWNEGSGRTEAEQRTLQALKSELEVERAELETRRNAYNRDSESVNKLADDLNALAAKLNLEVENFNGTFVRSRDFEKGVFDGSSINIYEFEKEEDLRVALIHEFGHALGLGHIENPKAIMNRKLALQDLENIRLSEEDIRQLREVLNQ
jgi:hypothetical protein